MEDDEIVQVKSPSNSFKLQLAKMKNNEFKVWLPTESNFSSRYNTLELINEVNKTQTIWKDLKKNKRDKYLESFWKRLLAAWKLAI